MKEYITWCGGDANWTLDHPNFVPPPPPAEDDGRRRVSRNIRPKPFVRRNIVSSAYASKFSYAAQGIIRERLLCCWDDPLDPNHKCIRDKCPYRHSTALLAQGPKDDFFAMIPCTFAGMRGGCKYHSQRLGPLDPNLFIQPFAMEGSTNQSSDPPDPDPHIDSVAELVPVFDGHRWCKREFKVSTSKDKADLDTVLCISWAVNSFLGGDHSDHSEGPAADDY